MGHGDRARLYLSPTGNNGRLNPEPIQEASDVIIDLLRAVRSTEDPDELRLWVANEIERLQDEADNLQDTVSALLTAKRSFSDHLALTRRIHDTINDVYSKRIAAKASTKP